MVNNRGAFRRFIAGTILLIISSPILFGDDFLFQSRDMSDLAVPRVTDITSDRRGYIWAATPVGILRYDGQEAELWDRKRIPGLPSENISVVRHHPGTGLLWIGTDAGIGIVNPLDGSFGEGNFSHIGRRNLSLQVRDIEISAVSGVFVLTTEGLYHSDAASGSRKDDVELLEIQEFGSLVSPSAAAAVSDTSGSSTIVQDLSVDESGEVWALTLSGLKRWNDETGGFIDIPGTGGGTTVRCIGDSIWIGTEEGIVYNYRPSGDTEVYQIDRQVSDFARDRDGQIWASTLTGGLAVLNADSDEFENCVIEAEHPYRLSTTSIASLYSDGNHLWIGALESGLYSVDVRQRNHLEYTRRSGFDSLPNGPIGVITEDSLGYVWTGSDIGGLARIDPVTGQVRQYTYDEADFFSLNSDHITAVLEDSIGNIWIGTDAGPALYISEIEGFEPPGLMMGGWPDAGGVHVLALAEGGDGGIWMSLQNGDVYKLDLLDRNHQSFAFSALSVPTVFHTDRFGSVWAGSRTNLWLFGDNGRLVSSWLLDSEPMPRSLAGGIVAIFTDSQDRNWFGGPGGLAVYRDEVSGFEDVILPDGRELAVSGISEDAEGNLWIANGREIIVLDSNFEYRQSIGADNGFMPSGQISTISRSSSGDIRVGANGQVWVFPSIPEGLSPEIPDVHLESLSISDREVLDARQASELEKLKLYPENNTLRIDFTSVIYGNIDSIGFEHRLEGVEEKWLPADESRRIYYANLPYGDSAFAIRAYDRNSGIRGRVTTLNISVARPGWQRWYALVLYVGLVAAVIAVIVKLREGELLKRQVVELERAESEARKAEQVAREAEQNARYSEQVALEAEKEARETREQLRILTMKDTLTGLQNRRGFDETMKRAMGTASRNNLLVSLFMLDVDFFKRYNDNYGHVSGDEVLRAVGRALSAVFSRVTDIVARYGGEEFSVAIVGDNPDSVLALADELLTAMRNLDIVHEFSDVSDRLTMSVGSATIRGSDRMSVEDLVDLSDKALYRAKSGGRNRVCFAGILPDLPESMSNETEPLVFGADD